MFTHRTLMLSIVSEAAKIKITLWFFAVTLYLKCFVPLSLPSFGESEFFVFYFNLSMGFSSVSFVCL